MTSAHARYSTTMTANSAPAISLTAKRPAARFVTRIVPPLALAATFYCAPNLDQRSAALFDQRPLANINSPTIPAAPAALTTFAVSPDNLFAGTYDNARLSTPLRDGYSHPAAVLLEDYIMRHPNAAGDISSMLQSNAERSLFVSDTIRLLAHFLPFTPEWRAQIVAMGLASPSVSVRDAAIQAVEIWDEPLLIGILQRHREPEPWLATYQMKLLSLMAG
jgi:hypothetical protein